MTNKVIGNKNQAQVRLTLRDHRIVFVTNSMVDINNQQNHSGSDTVNVTVAGDETVMEIPKPQILHWWGIQHHQQISA